MNNRCFVTAICYGACFLLLVGCNRSLDRASVNGTITLDGQLVESGSITFFPTDGVKGPSAGAAITDGRYVIEATKGVAIGKNRIILNGNKKTGRRIPSPFDPTAKIDEVVQVFPPEYGTESMVIKDVHAGDNLIDFNIVSTKKVAK